MIITCFTGCYFTRDVINSNKFSIMIPVKLSFSSPMKIQPNKGTVHLINIGPWKNVNEYVLISVHQNLFL